MSKRFTETGKWRDRWFMLLPAEQKLAWIYVCDECDHAGIIEIIEPLANMQIGMPVNWSQFFDACGHRVVLIGEGKYWVRSFCDFQYGTLNPENRVHNSVLKRLKQMGLASPLEAPSEGAREGAKDKDKDKDKDQEKEIDKDQDQADAGAQAAKRTVAMRCPPEVCPDAWRDWNAIRKAKKLGPATQSVLNGVRSEAAKAGLSVGEAIKIAAGESWGGFKAAWLARAGGRGDGGQKTFAELSLDNTRKAIEDFSNG
jgi:hypothetical protein